MSGNGNLIPWKPGESGNPRGGSKRASARAAAKRVGGLAPALRELLDQSCPEELLAGLTEEQRAGIDGNDSLARFLAAKLLAAAAEAKNLDDFARAISLVISVDTKATIQESSEPWERVVERLPDHLSTPLQAAIEAQNTGGDPSSVFQLHLDGSLDEAQRARMYRATMGNIDLSRFPPAKLERFVDALSAEDRELYDRVYAEAETAVAGVVDSLSDEDREAFDRILTGLRSAPMEEKFQAFCSGDIDEDELGASPYVR